MGVIFLAGLLLTGCDATPMAPKKVNGAGRDEIKPVESVASDRLSDIERMERCQRELEALKKIDIKVYDRGVRSDVRESTQNAVDAYYRYRVDKMCADISKNVLDSLSDKNR